MIAIAIALAVVLLLLIGIYCMGVEIIAWINNQQDRNDDE